MARNPCLWLCGRDADSTEDVFPNWLRDQLRAKPQRRRRWKIASVIDPSIPRPIVETPTTIRNALSVKASKAVCTTCNTGWMSDLQSAAKPMIGPMVDGQRVSIGPGDQRLAAAWATMTGITFNYASGDSVDESARLYLGSHHSPPPNTVVWLARIEPVKQQAVFMNARLASELYDRTYVYVEAFGFGHLGLLILRGVLPPNHEGRSGQFAASSLLIVYPPILTGVSRPPDRSVSFVRLVQISQDLVT